MTKKRKSMPSNEKILDFWCSKEGTKLLEKYGIMPYGIHSLTIDAGEECWCCNVFCCEGYYDGWASAKKKNKWYGDYRERCHIVAKSLGGTNECDNLFLMCSDCHRTAPNTDVPEIFFKWVSKTNKAAILYKKEFIMGMSEIAKRIFQTKMPDYGTEQYKMVLDEIHKFNMEVFGEPFIEYSKGKTTAHGFGGRFHLDILASTLGLYEQYCMEKKSILFPNLCGCKIPA